MKDMFTIANDAARKRQAAFAAMVTALPPPRWYHPRYWQLIYYRWWTGS
jgi:hypothetical protein